jgi:hypothetical protein
MKHRALMTTSSATTKKPTRKNRAEKIVVVHASVMCKIDGRETNEP